MTKRRKRAIAQATRAALPGRDGLLLTGTTLGLVERIQHWILALDLVTFPLELVDRLMTLGNWG